MSIPAELTKLSIDMLTGKISGLGSPPARDNIPGAFIYL
jgi:hypothetical protein